MALAVLCASLLSDVRAQTDTEFWFAAPDVSIGSNAFDTPIVLRFTTLQAASTVTVSQPANPGFQPIVTTIPANSTATVNLTAFLGQVETAPPNTVLNTGLYITATEAVGAYYEVVSAQCQCNPEIFALKGRNAVGTDFLVPFQNYLNNANYTPVPFAELIVVATEDNTTVTITPTQPLVGHPAGVPFSIILNSGQTWAGRATSQAAAAHPGGTRVVSNRPIAITMADDLLSGAPFGGCADLLGDQIVPTWRVGEEYIVMKGALNGPDRIFVLGISDATSITLGGAPSGTVNAGQTVWFDITQPSTYLLTSAPVYVLHLSGFGCEVGGALLPPIVCTGSSQLGFTRSTQEQFALNLMTRAGNETGFSINGNPALVPSTAFTIVPNTNGEWVSAQIYFTTAQLPQGVGNIITNTLGKFHMGIIHGSVSSGTRYGYFSDFSVVETPIIVAANEVCAGEELVLSATSDPGAVFTWSGPLNFSSQQGTTSVPLATPEHSGTYTVVAELDGCSSNPASIDVVVDFCAEDASGVINGYSPVVAINPCNRTIEVVNASVFSEVSRALLIQMKGAIGETGDIPEHGNLNDMRNAGNYEYVSITGISGNTISIEFDLLLDYDLDGSVQLVTVPVYDNLVISQTLTAQPWDGLTGGVLVFEVTGNLSMLAPIDVSGTGFRGGLQSLSYYQGCSSMGYVYDYATGIAGEKGEGIAEYLPNGRAGRGKLVNGGGGGNHVNAGGAGGGNGGVGGLGGNQWSGCPPIGIGGIGGQSLDYSGGRVFMGGGGGGGQQNDGFNVATAGTRGGGIAMIRAGSITSGGFQIRADGAEVTAVAANDGSGGGGGGGVVMMDCPQVNAPLLVTARGGRGGSTSTANHGPGGGGGGGVILLAGQGLPTITTDVAGGLAGQVSTGASYGAEPGASGITQTGLQWAESASLSEVVAELELYSNSPVCEGSELASGTVSADVFSVVWSGPGGFTSEGASFLLSNATPEMSGMYSATGVDALGCELAGEIELAVFAGSQVEVTDVICEGGNYVLPDGMVVSDPGTYTALLVSLVTGCDSLVVVQLGVIPQELTSVEATVCQGGLYTLPDGTQTGQAGTYLTELVLSGTECTAVVTTTLSVLPTYQTTVQAAVCEGEGYGLPGGQVASVSGNYPYTWLSLAGCDSVVTTQLTVHPLPQAGFTWLPETPDVINPQVQLVNASQGASGWLWDLGVFGISEEENPHILLPSGQPGQYPICLLAVSTEGCVDFVCGIIPVVADLYFYCPNAFTPGTDGINDLFRPVMSGHEPSDYLFQIFNRWGDVVFETTDADRGWPGDHRDGAFYAQNEVYLWRAEVRRIEDSQKHTYTGHVVVVR